MAAGIQFTSYIPTSLVGNNSPSPTLAAEVVTGLPIPTGAFPGNVFYLTEAQANQLSQVAVNGATQMTCHAGWYMVVQVSADATADLIAAGRVGAQAAIATTNAESNASVPPQAVVTDVVSSATALGNGVNPVVFLNAVTPGNYTIVQIAGDTNVLNGASAAATLGEVLTYSATTGEALANAAATGITTTNYPLILGTALEAIAESTIGRANVAFPFGII